MPSQQTPISRQLARGSLSSGGVQDRVNLHDYERWASLVGGGLLTALGIKRGGAAGFGLAALGAGFLYRGSTGHCHLYSALHVSTAEKHGPASSVPADRGTKVVESILVNRPADQLYQFWRNLDGLPRFMSHLVSVQDLGKYSHWVAKGPAGIQASWDAEIVNDEPGRLLAWRSLAGSRISTAGSVHFATQPGDRGTEVTVTLKYDPPAGALGAWFAWLTGNDPKMQIREDLRRFRQLAETGEVATAAAAVAGS